MLQTQGALKWTFDTIGRKKFDLTEDSESENASYKVGNILKTYLCVILWYVSG